MSSLMRLNIFLLLFFLCGYFFSQEKSKVIEKINGKEYYVHQVKKGESLYGIAKMYGVDMESILRENPEVKENGLKAGKNVIIPVIKNIPNNSSNNTLDTLKYKYHQVLKGQTIYSICKTYNISQEKFFEYNPDKKNGIKENDWVIVGEKEAQPRMVNNNAISVAKDIVEKSNVNFLKYEKKKSYNALALLPFDADKSESLIIEDLVKNNQSFPAMSSMMIDFYKGLLYAVDSLKTDSFNVHLLPIDIKESDTLKIQQVVNTSEYKNADFIIGPVYSSVIKAEQKWAQDKKFHLIPFIGYNKFLFNHPEYSKTTPSIYNDIQELANYVFDSLRKTTEVVLIYSGANGDNDYAKEFRRHYNHLVYQSNSKDTIVTYKNIQEFKKAVKEKKHYTVVLLTNNQIIATDYITQLSIINKTSPIQLCGFYKTTTFDNLDLEYLNQMNFTFSYYQNINYSNLFTTYVSRYKNEFQTEPSVFFYEGLQIGLYYFDLIKQYGLNELYQLNEHKQLNNNVFMRFKFYHPDENTGFQNNGEFIFRVIDRKVTIMR